MPYSMTQHNATNQGTLRLKSNTLPLRHCAPDGYLHLQHTRNTELFRTAQLKSADATILRCSHARKEFTLYHASTFKQVIRLTHNLTMGPRRNQQNTVKPDLSGNSKTRPDLFFKSEYRLMQVKSIADWSKGRILQYFRPSLSYHLSLRSVFCLVLSDRLIQVLRHVCVRKAMNRISLIICPVWSESSLCDQWITMVPSIIHTDSEDSDQTDRIHRLASVTAALFDFCVWRQRINHECDLHDCHYMYYRHREDDAAAGWPNTYRLTNCLLVPSA